MNRNIGREPPLRARPPLSTARVLAILTAILLGDVLEGKGATSSFREVPMKIPLQVAVILLVSLLFIGCATMSDVLKGKDDGTVSSYAVNSDQAWEIAMAVLRWEGCETIEEHRSLGYMLTTVGENFVSAGCLVGVWVEPLEPNNTKVTVVTKRKIQTNLATGLTESTFHRRFAQAVAIIRGGKQLPPDPPAED
jgi:hypothetical protein